ncbi:MAG: hypothetical protein KDA86_15700 [Planctomycetaceae bacterium]|nr:hypothetical protein [Planctomycetaceae bacterium]
MSEQTRHVIVFESQPFWAPELQRQFLDDDVHVRTCRSINDLQQRLAKQTYDVCIIDLSADLPGVLRWLGDWQIRGSHTAILVIAAEEQKSLEWHVRELGASSFATEYVTGIQVAGMCRKQWNKTS